MRIYQNKLEFFILGILIIIILSPIIYIKLHRFYLYDFDRVNCYKQGKVRRVGQWGNQYCVTVYSDGGKPCENSQQCQGNCIVKTSSNIGPGKYVKYEGGFCEVDDGYLGFRTKVEDCKMIDNEYLCPIQFTIE